VTADGTIDNDLIPGPDSSGSKLSSGWDQSNPSGVHVQLVALSPLDDLGVASNDLYPGLGCRGGDTVNDPAQFIEREAGLNYEA